MVFIAYVVFVGGLTTLVAMNETLASLKKQLAEIEDATWQTVKAVRTMSESKSEKQNWPEIRT